MTDDLFHDLIRRLDAGSAERARLDDYYAGRNPLSYLSPEAKAALGNRLTRVSVNIPKLLVDALAERLSVSGVTGVDVWEDWMRAGLDLDSDLVHREAMVLGTSYVLVWADANRRPLVSAESAHQVTVVTDPGTREVTAAIKRWTTSEATVVVLYQPDVVTRYESPTIGATGGFTAVSRIDNPFGVVPVVEFTNGGRLLEPGVSEMESVLTLADANTKLITDMMVASEAVARPRRWATGIELAEDEDGTEVSPFPETDKLMVAEPPDARFGQLPGSDLGGYENAVGVVMRQISAVTGLPEHMLGIGGDNPTSADSIRASEAALTAKAEAKQRTFGRSWEQVVRLMVSARTGAAPESVDPQIAWRSASTRSEAQVADAVTKLFSAGLLPASVALTRLGYSEAEVATIRNARRAEALDGAGVNLASVLTA